MRSFPSAQDDISDAPLTPCESYDSIRAESSSKRLRQADRRLGSRTAKCPGRRLAYLEADQRFRLLHGRGHLIDHRYGNTILDPLSETRERSASEDHNIGLVLCHRRVRELHEQILFLVLH